MSDGDKLIKAAVLQAESGDLSFVISHPKDLLDEELEVLPFLDIGTHKWTSLETYVTIPAKVLPTLVAAALDLQAYETYKMTDKRLQERWTEASIVMPGKLTSIGPENAVAYTVLRHMQRRIYDTNNPVIAILRNVVALLIQKVADRALMMPILSGEVQK